MSVNSPLDISRSFLATISTKMFRYYEDRILQDASVLVVSNHRSFMDAPVLMEALSSPIRFACHHYMGQVPIMREIVTGLLGCFPLENPENRQNSFFQQSQTLLQSKQMVGVFPEGTKPMVKFTPLIKWGISARICSFGIAIASWGFSNFADRDRFFRGSEHFCFTLKGVEFVWPFRTFIQSTGFASFGDLSSQSPC